MEESLREYFNFPEGFTIIITKVNSTYTLRVTAGGKESYEWTIKVEKKHPPVRGDTCCYVNDIQTSLKEIKRSVYRIIFGFIGRHMFTTYVGENRMRQYDVDDAKIEYNYELSVRGFHVGKRYGGCVLVHPLYLEWYQSELTKLRETLLDSIRPLPTPIRTEILSYFPLQCIRRPMKISELL